MGRPKREHTRANRVNPGKHIAGKGQTFREKNPHLNWAEADEVSDEDLEAAGVFYKRLKESHHNLPPVDKKHKAFLTKLNAYQPGTVCVKPRVILRVKTSTGGYEEFGAFTSPDDSSLDYLIYQVYGITLKDLTNWYKKNKAVIHIHYINNDGKTKHVIARNIAGKWEVK